MDGLHDIIAETARRGGRRFGPRVSPINGAGEFHNGVDLACPIGTPLHAPWDGMVEFARNAGMGGNQINIWHDNGLCSKFLHLDRFKATKGKRVIMGEIIGWSGNTGASTGPHLHFSLMDADLRNDQRRMIDPAKYYLDPLPYLSNALDPMMYAFLAPTQTFTDEET
jgi:murein DD-endopeptidase MepM/ murein hydrolase activator NlpD